MKALSLTQPWATAILLGLKAWETRGWPTKYRGPLAIHAAKAMPLYARDRFDAEAHGDRRFGNWADMDLTRGAVLATCRLVDCRRTEDIAPRLSHQELDWGEFTPGRFAFHLIDVVALATPVPWRGALSIWECPGVTAPGPSFDADARSNSPEDVGYPPRGPR